MHARQRRAAVRSASAQFSHDDDSFCRKAAQAAYNQTLGTNITHDLHFGYQRDKDYEDRFQTSNGWGLISIPARRRRAGTCPASACGASTPAFFVATVAQQGAGAARHPLGVRLAERRDQRHHPLNNWTFNVGVMDSQDKLYGQGLAKANNFAGFIASPGTKYLMHVFYWKDMIQPRLGATWAYNGRDTVFASFARYMPPANSDARAASWDRNLVRRQRLLRRERQSDRRRPGRLLFRQVVAGGNQAPPRSRNSCSVPRVRSTKRWSVRLYGRARKGDHYLEDTNNTARSAFNAPPGVPTDAYVPDLCDTSLATCSKTNTIRGAIGSGSSYVIANLDGAFTKYYEATAESEYHDQQVHAARLVYLEALLRQLRPGLLARSASAE